MDPERQVQHQPGTPRRTRGGELARGDELNVAMVVAGLLRDVRRRQPSGPRPFGPLVPQPPERLAEGAEPRVVLQGRVRGREGLQFLAAAPSAGEQASRSRREDAPLGRRHAAVVHKGLPACLLQERSGLGQRLRGRRRRRQLGEGCDVDEDVVPEPARHGGVGARLERVVQERGEQRQGRHDVAALPADPFLELGEIPEIADAEGTSGVDGVEGNERAPESRPLRSGRRRAGCRDHQRLAPAPPCGHREPVVSQRRSLSEPDIERDVPPAVDLPLLTHRGARQVDPEGGNAAVLQLQAPTEAPRRGPRRQPDPQRREPSAPRHHDRFDRSPPELAPARP